jgi:hypothetical protein
MWQCSEFRNTHKGVEPTCDELIGQETFHVHRDMASSEGHSEVVVRLIAGPGSRSTPITVWVHMPRITEPEVPVGLKQEEPAGARLVQPEGCCVRGATQQG